MECISSFVRSNTGSDSWFMIHLYQYHQTMSPTLGSQSLLSYTQTVLPYLILHLSFIIPLPFTFSLFLQPPSLPITIRHCLLLFLHSCWVREPWRQLLSIRVWRGIHATASHTKDQTQEFPEPLRQVGTPLLSITLRA